jgi:hypothetical protein
MNRICLWHFRDWIGEAAPVESITGVKWLEWFNYLCGQIDKGVWGASHCDRILAVSKRFVRFLWELEMIDLPRNLDKKDLSFTVRAKEIETFTEEELRALLNVTTGQSELHVLLMLNAGLSARTSATWRKTKWTGTRELSPGSGVDERSRGCAGCGTGCGHEHSSCSRGGAAVILKLCC